MSSHRTRIMYIEDKSEGLEGPARIGRVTYSKSGRSLSYAGRTFRPLGGRGYKANYEDVSTGEQFWISGPRRDGADGLYGARTTADMVDDDIAEPYWVQIRARTAPPGT